MDAPLETGQVLLPASFSELFSLWGRFPDAEIFAGGTAHIREGGEISENVKLMETPSLPKNILSLEKIEELRTITRTERFLDFGAMVRLNDIASIGKTVPEALVKTMEGIAGPQVRSLATIGGAVCGLRAPGGGVDIAAPLVALNAHYELRTAGQNRSVSAMSFSSAEHSVLNPGELLARVRIPMERWDFTFYRKFRSRDLGGEKGGVLVFVARREREILTEVRIVFSGISLLRDSNSENWLKGRTLPLDRKEVRHFREMWEAYLSGMAAPCPLLKAKIANRIELCLLTMAE